MCRGEGKRAPVDHLADPCHEVFPGLAEAPPITITDGFSRFTNGGEDVAEVPAGLAQRLDGLQVPLSDEAQDIAAARAGRPSCVSAVATAGPEATASRHP